MQVETGERLRSLRFESGECNLLVRVESSESWRTVRVESGEYNLL